MKLCGDTLICTKTLWVYRLMYSGTRSTSIYAYVFGHAQRATQCTCTGHRIVRFDAYHMHEYEGSTHDQTGYRSYISEFGYRQFRHISRPASFFSCPPSLALCCWALPLPRAVGARTASLWEPVLGSRFTRAAPSRLGQWRPASVPQHSTEGRTPCGRPRRLRPTHA